MNFEYIGTGLSAVSIITASLPFVRDLTTSSKKDAQVFLKELSDYSDNIVPRETKSKCLQKSFEFLTKLVVVHIKKNFEHMICSLLTWSRFCNKNKIN